MRRLLLPCALLGLLASCPTAAALFNLAPDVGRVTTPIVCGGGNFTVVESARGTGHVYRCDGRDVTFVASALTWVLIVVVLGAVATPIVRTISRRLDT